MSIKVSRDREIKTRNVQGVRRKEITRSDFSIAILAQCCMSILQSNPDSICEKLDLADTVKEDLDFFLKS